jgi:hypothetical protein
MRHTHERSGHVHDQDACDDNCQGRAVHRRSHRLRSRPVGDLRNSTDSYLKVYDRGPGHADVTERPGGVWEPLLYDWSDPNHVVAPTIDSNAWGGQSGHTYTFTRDSNGTTDIDYVVVREGKNLKGRFLGVVLGSVGKSRLVKAFSNSVEAIEARN